MAVTLSESCRPTGFEFPPLVQVAAGLTTSLRSQWEDSFDLS